MRLGANIAAIPNTLTITSESHRHTGQIAISKLTHDSSMHEHSSGSNAQHSVSRRSSHGCAAWISSSGLRHCSAAVFHLRDKRDCACNGARDDSPGRMFLQIHTDTIDVLRYKQCQVGDHIQ